MARVGTICGNHIIETKTKPKQRNHNLWKHWRGKPGAWKCQERGRNQSTPVGPKSANTSPTWRRGSERGGGKSLDWGAKRRDEQIAIDNTKGKTEEKVSRNIIGTKPASNNQARERIANERKANATDNVVDYLRKRNATGKIECDEVATKDTNKAYKVGFLLAHRRQVSITKTVVQKKC